MNSKFREVLKQVLLLTAGSIISALAVKSILVPQEFLARGVTGISLIIFYKTQAIPLSVLYLLINIPIFLLGWKFVGVRFTLYSLVGLGIYTVILAVVPFELQLTDKLLGALTAGALSGIGVAIILRSYGSSGGAEILYVIINKLTSIPIGTASLIINGVIVGVMAFLFPIENVLYTLVYITVTMYISNKVFHGLANRQAVFIVSDKWKEISACMIKSRIGVTTIEGKGGYKGMPRIILYSVINKNMVMFLKNSVKTTDPNAFIAIMTAEDVTGIDIGNQPHW